ncbi:hypothetical protein U9M48_023226 [Paspalum notatum var. saurae]|uniref:Uncharacterized protein n=1 Tax=Paspalum notatum var. saurae TaxID=547442 RepID=A0AAQ3TP11_PASNO
MQLWLCCVPWMDGHHALLLFLPPRPSSPPSRPALTSMARRLLLAPAPAWCRKSRRTGLRQRGQRGSASDSMTYMRQRGQAASTMDVASGLSDHCSPWPWWCWSRSPSDDRHELGDDDHSSSDDTADAPLPEAAGVLCSAEELRTSGGALLVLCSCWVWGKKKRWQQVFIGGKWAVEAMDGGQLVFLIAAALLRSEYFASLIDHIILHPKHTHHSSLHCPHSCFCFMGWREERGGGQPGIELNSIELKKQGKAMATATPLPALSYLARWGEEEGMEWASGRRGGLGFVLAPGGRGGGGKMT